MARSSKREIGDRRGRNRERDSGSRRGRSVSHTRIIWLLQETPYGLRYARRKGIRRETRTPGKRRDRSMRVCKAPKVLVPGDRKLRVPSSEVTLHRVRSGALKTKGVRLSSKGCSFFFQLLFHLAFPLLFPSLSGLGWVVLGPLWTTSTANHLHVICKVC
jgi:hypothetical protein